MADAIEPLVKLSNRWQRRRYEEEALKVVEELESVNTEFLFHLFDESNSESYKELYSKFHNKWQDAIKTILRSRKIKYIGIDLLWFSENYKPLK
tara:strand:- start:142 stop:423 length:282 start_codon:yes stop_codon:yes gene_type:complete